MALFGVNKVLALKNYSSAQGRFTSVDPENGGASPDDPQSWNGYAYARNNPLMYVDPDGLKFLLRDKDGNVFEISDEQARAGILNEEYQASIGNTVIKGVNKNGWLTGEIRDSEGNLVGQFTKVSADDIPAFGNAVLDLADKITHDPVVWATIGALKVYGRRASKRDPVKEPVPSLDASGKVHTNPPNPPLPKYVPKSWTREQLVEARDALRKSIQERKAEQRRLGEEGGHRRRIGEEERLLRQIEKKLSGS